MTVINGIDLDGLCHEAEALDLPPAVDGRIVHIDADFLAYQVSAEKIQPDGEILDEDTKSFDEMKHNAEVAMETLMGLAGATSAVLHLTPSGSTKGGRYDAAMIKEYQGNRKDKPKPRLLAAVRQWMADEKGAVMNYEAEADDSMAIAQYEAIRDNRHHLSVIASKDKDLRMVPGLQLDWDRGVLHDSDNFGYLELVEGSSGQKKLIGRGWKFFWAQMLMGDTADNISGLPLVCGKVLNKVDKTAAVIKAYEVMQNPLSTPKQRQKAAETLDNRKPKSCGPVMAYNILNRIDDNKTAFAAVRELYRECEKVQPFVNYRCGTVITAGDAFASEARLLWMRRHHNPEDAFHWMQEECL